MFPSLIVFLVLVEHSEYKMTLTIPGGDSKDVLKLNFYFYVISLVICIVNKKEKSEREIIKELCVVHWPLRTLQKVFKSVCVGYLVSSR